MTDQMDTAVSLAVTVAGLEFKNPVITASGTFGYGLEFLEILDLSRLGGLVTKGLSVEPMDGNPPPRIVETHGGMLNSIGLQNIGARAFVRDKLPVLRGYDTHVITNIFGFSVDDYLEVVRILNDGDGISAYELNISCPNVKKGGMEIGHDPAEAARLTEKVKRIARCPVLVKLSPNTSSITEVARSVEAAGADGVSVINTLLGMSVDIYRRRSRMGTAMGGLSGPAIKPIALRMVRAVAQTVRIPVLGIGGIAGWQDAVEFLVAGATAIQIGTANYYEPRVSIHVVEGLAAYLRDMRIPSIQELIGSLQD
jgi:dihydroorotate dehydrogenase (NAD+) catalytic subunit